MLWPICQICYFSNEYDLFCYWLVHVKGQSQEIFKLWFFFIKHLPQATDLHAKIVSKTVANSLRYSSFTFIITQLSHDLAESLLSGVNGTAKSWLSSVVDTAESKLSNIDDTAESVKITFCIWCSIMTQQCHWRHWVSKDTDESIIEPFKGSHLVWRDNQTWSKRGWSILPNAFEAKPQ